MGFVWGFIWVGAIESDYVSDKRMTDMVRDSKRRDAPGGKPRLLPEALTLGPNQWRRRWERLEPDRQPKGKGGRRPGLGRSILTGLQSGQTQPFISLDLQAYIRCTHYCKIILWFLSAWSASSVWGKLRHGQVNLHLCLSFVHVG
ncbi:uncharacterized protein RHO17_011794 isoform 1-T1 [Thomomys bottae]